MKRLKSYDRLLQNLAQITGGILVPIGKLQRPSLREVWEDEAQNFTPWLRDNIEVLNEVLEHEEIELYLSDAKIEQEAGDFSVDMIAKADSGDLVVIENQLEPSDHDHLGKLITYLTAFSAKSAIWINAYPRPEHINAINWLNESTDAAFYLLKLEAIQIDESNHAPLLTLIVGKNPEQIKKEPEDPDGRDNIRYKFWEELLNLAKSKTDLYANISPQKSSYISTGAGKAGLYYQYDILMHEAKVELYIDSRNKRRNKRIFDTFRENEASINAGFGEGLEWQRLDNKRACRIMKTLNIGGYRDENTKWSEIQNAMIDTMIRLDIALKPHIDELKI
ncbi:DUF4268 domain-containing protein [Methanosaeta sp. UBA356]|jgi:hypothetical protein|uniref:DUF4268 domain-containing protein n=1 Tax=Methanosaeta sp. UBA356 TaxID=1915559 RepID=UPI00257C06BC|nr:DUF4268 domain-containing protein [Methanosaeta sp. UBA356]